MRRAMAEPKALVAYAVTYRGTQKFWSRIGVAFVRSDNSIDLKLEAIPVSGEIHIREAGRDGLAPKAVER